MSAQSKKPAGGSGPDSEALVSDESESNYRSFHGERKELVRDFITEMHRFVPPELFILKMQFRGDPARDGMWWARPLARNAAAIDDGANVYFTVAAFGADSARCYHRRKEQFGGGILLMIDDLGTGAGAKFPLSKIEALPPTALIETSPDNFQAIYMFDRLLTDQAEFKALIDAFVREKFLGQDTGMKGVTRVFRPPVGVNGKPKYGGNWLVRLAQWAPERRYSVNEIVAAFGLELRSEPPRRRSNIHPNVADMRIDYFLLIARELQRLGMVRATASDDAWLDIRCPWVDEHTGGVDNGAAIARPGPANDWHGGFHCHHGHCAERGWRDLTQWLADESAGVLEEINQAASEEWGREK